MEDKKDYEKSNYFEALMYSMGWRGTIKAFRGIEAILVLGVVFLVFANTVARYVFNANIIWCEEVLLILSMWMYFIGGMLGSEEQSHISGDLVSGSLRNRKVKKWVLAVVNSINTFICGYFSYLAINFCIQQVMLGSTTAYLRVPKGTSQWAVAVGLVGMCFFWLIHTLRYLKKDPATILTASEQEEFKSVEYSEETDEEKGEEETK